MPPACRGAPGDAARRRLAEALAEPRWRLGRGRRHLSPPRRHPRRYRHGDGPSTASQTAWALLALMAAGAVEDPAVERGAAWLLARQAADGSWPEEDYTGTGFPRVFYLRYHGYAQCSRYGRWRGCAGCSGAIRGTCPTGCDRGQVSRSGGESEPEMLKSEVCPRTCRAVYNASQHHPLGGHPLSMPLSSILAVVGMRSEAALLPEIPVIVSGGDPVRLRALLLHGTPRGCHRRTQLRHRWRARPIA